MSRDISIKSIVRLLRMTTMAPVAPAWQLLTAATAVAEDGLPSFIERARKRLFDELEIFKTAMQPREIADPGARGRLSVPFVQWKDTLQRSRQEEEAEISNELPTGTADQRLPTLD